MAGSLLLWALSLVALASPAPRPDTVAAALDPPDDDYVGRDLKLISLDVTTYVVDDALDDPEDVIAYDLDGDGQPEILSAAAGFVSISKKQGGMLDYEKAVVYADDDLSDETYEGDYLYPWTRRVVANASGLDHAFTRIMGVDMDGDGDLDVVAAGLEWEKLAWYENTRGNGLWWELHVIYEWPADAIPGNFDIEVGDLDGDGDVDVLTASYYTDTVAWYEAAPSGSGNGTNWTYHMISDRFPTIGATGVALADMNGDGKLDVLAASLGDRYIVWFDRRLDAEDAWDIVVVGDGVNGPYDTQPRDFDGDGDADVVCASTNDNRLAWYENLYGDGRFWRLHVITTTALSVHSMYVADIDEDGDLDILSANFADDAVVWYEQYDDDRGHQSWSRGAVVEAGVDGATSVFGVDMDGDADLDVVTASLSTEGVDNVAWHDLNLVPAPTPAPTITFRPTSVPTSSPTILPSVAPTIEDPLKPTARPTHRPSPVPTPKPTPFRYTWQDFVREYRLYIAGIIVGVLACCCCHCFCKALKPIILLMEPYYMPTVTHMHKKWKRSETRRIICYPCPEICRGQEPEDPLYPKDGVELRGDYDIPVRVVYDEPRRKGKTELIQTAPREITFIQRFEFYSCYS